MRNGRRRIARARDGLGLLEVLVAAVVGSFAITAYLGLGAQESQWTRDVDDRAKAMAVARNMLVLVEYGYRDELNAAPSWDGVQVLSGADQALPEGALAYGTGLFEWVQGKRQQGGFDVKVAWTPSPVGAGSDGAAPVGQATCSVTYRSGKGEARCVELTRILTH